MLFIALLLLLSDPPAADVGGIWIKTMPGVSVSVDGVEKGLTTTDESGKEIQNVTAGKHKLVLRLADSAPVEREVTVVAAETTTVVVSALALNARNVNVPGPTDAIAQLDVPAEWRRALISSWLKGIQLSGFVRDDTKLRFVLRTANANDAALFVHNLRHQTAVKRVQTEASRIGDSIEVRLTVQF